MMTMTLYIIFIILFLFQLDLWRADQVKNTIIWFVSVALISFFNIDKIKDNSAYFKEAIKDNIKIIVIIEFLLSVYTFSLPVELIYIPLTATLGILIAVSSRQEKHKAVTAFLNNALLMIGLIIIGYTIYKLVTDFSEIYQEKTLYDFSVPILLSLLFLPFLYFLKTFMEYESVFSRLPNFIDDPLLMRHAKYKSILKFKFNTTLLKRWCDSLVIKKPKSNKEIDFSIDKIFSIIKKEKNPKSINKEDGWSPYEAMTFLKDKGIETGYYKELYDGEWFASSPLKKLSDRILSNNIAYYIDGTEDTAKKLKIKININEPDNQTDDLQYFGDIAELLYHKALSINVANDIKKAILSKLSFNKRINNSKECKIEVEPYLNNNGYSIKFTIESI